MRHADPDARRDNFLSANAAVGGNKGATLGKPRQVQEEITKTLSRLWHPWNRRHRSHT
jgi:hypothetical protein